MNDVNALARGVILAGFDGTSAPPDVPHFGGYVLFARNCPSLAAVRALTDALRQRTQDGLEPLVALDQEGGRVVRLQGGVEAMPSAMALGAAADVELAGRAGEQIAFDLRRAGCTLNLAPVLDLALFEHNTVIGTRSLGGDPQAVAALGAALGAGMRRGGVAPCYKHFPGHGSTDTDSHAALPVIPDDAPTLRARDLLPFAAVAPTAPAFMSAHVLARAFDDVPATVSQRLMTGVLRDELHFGGVLVTDCVEMAALREGGGTVNGAVAALIAGADLLTVSHDVDAALAIVQAIERAVAGGTLPIERLEEAYARTARLRRAIQPPLPLETFPPHPGVGREIARRAVTLIRGFARTDPLATIVVSFDGERSAGAEEEAARPSLRRESPALAELRVPLDPTGPEVDAAFDAIARSGRRPLVLSRRAHVHPTQAAAIDRLLERTPDALVVSLLEPFDVALFARARHVLAAYGDDAASIGGLADVVFGGSLPQGRLPVRIEGLGGA